jgi:PhnB protein
MQINPYIMFKGNCAEAFKFYADALGGKIDMMMAFEDAPADAPIPPDWRKKIMHAAMSVGGGVLMGTDAADDRYKKPQGFTVSLVVTTPDEAERAFAALSKGGTVGMALQQTFFATRFGTVTDRFDIPWMVNCPAQV